MYLALLGVWRNRVSQDSTKAYACYVGFHAYPLEPFSRQTFREKE